MSVEAVRGFWQRVAADAELKDRLSTIQEKDRGLLTLAVAKVAAEAGFAFTADEYDAAVSEELAQRHAAGELSDEDMAQVAGGIGGSTPTMYHCTGGTVGPAGGVFQLPTMGCFTVGGGSGINF